MADSPQSSKTEPLPAEQVALIRQHLQEVLSSSTFASSKRAQEFLQLVVEHALADRIDSLKERMIGVEMFGRPIDYDTANDAVVRVKATEVRRRLAQYYLDAGREPPLRIELPVGSYVPKFLWQTDKSSSSGPGRAVLRAEVSPVQSIPSPRDSAASVPASERRPWRRWAVIALLFTLAAVAAPFALERWWGTSAIRSIAILPLLNLSGDPGQEYFADGMTDELISELGQAPGLRVISRTSTMTYKGTKKTVPVIARELRVDGVLEGSIEREGNKVRVIIQLIDSHTDQHIWSHSYERDLSSILEVQSQIARAITDQVRIELTPAQQAHFNRPRQTDPAALELYLHGMQSLNSGDPRTAIDLFHQAIAKDPDYSPTYAGLGNAYGWMGEAGWMPYAEAFAQQKAAALKAIELDDSRPEPHLELAMAAMNQDWDWATQRKELHRALEINPNSAAVHWTYASYLTRVGLAKDAIAEATIALQLDPVSSRSHTSLSFIYYYARQYDEALAEIQQAIALHPAIGETIFPLSIIYVEKHDYQKAIEQFQKMGDVPHGLGHLGNVYARYGRQAEAEAIIPKLQQHVAKTGIGRYEIALIYAGLQNDDKAFEWLENAFRSRDKGLTYLKIDPCLDPLRSDPRFASLVQRVGIPSS